MLQLESLLGNCCTFSNDLEKGKIEVPQPSLCIKTLNARDIGGRSGSRTEVADFEAAL
jgi:hypothetical protein